MVGLRSQEESRFVTFFEIVQKKAKELGAIFFLDCGEGNSVFYDDIICSNCSGWLVPFDKAKAFEKDYSAFKDNECWQDWECYLAWVTWKKSPLGLDIDISYV